MRNRTGCLRRLFLEPLERRDLLAGIPELVADINTVPQSLSRFRNPLVVGEDLFFAADDGVHGIELWKVDGETKGVSMVKDIRPGADSSTPSDLTEFRGELFFTIGEEELWRSDGTESGTVMVKNLDDNTSNQDDFIDSLVVFGDRLYFVADFELFGRSVAVVWSTDGTEEGTSVIESMTSRLISNRPRGQLLVVDDRLHFFFHVHSEALWIFDGEESTVLTSSTRFSCGSCREFFGWQGQLHAVTEGSFGTLVRRFDGRRFETLFGTASPLPFPFAKWEHEVVGDTLYFVGNDPEGGTEIWKSDGTIEGTRRVANVEPGPGDSFPRDLTAFEDRLLFSAETTESGREWWSTDGTALGTTQLGEINPSGDSSPQFASHHGIVLGDTFYFSAFDEMHGNEIWTTNGEQPNLLADIVPGIAGSNPSHMVAYAGNVYFGAGDQLWKTDGQSVEPVLPATKTDGSRPSELIAVDDRLIFTAFTPDRGTELWATDGYAEGTQLLLEDVEGQGPSAFRSFFRFQDEVYFVSTQNATKHLLWKVDTIDGSAVVLQSYVGAQVPRDFVATDSRFFFITGGDLETPATLWVSDGTVDGAVAVELPGEVRRTAVSSIKRMMPFGDTLYLAIGNIFVGDQIRIGIELVKIAPGSTEAVVVKDINPGRGDSLLDPYTMTPVGDELFFFASQDGANIEFWKTDGTEEGTVLLRGNANLTGNLSDIPACDVTRGCGQNWMIDAGGFAYFTVFNGDLGNRPEDWGYQLWRSDGTVEGTTIVSRLYSAPSFDGGIHPLRKIIETERPHQPQMLDGVLYFIQKSENGRAIWRSDGTAEGTFPVSEFSNRFLSPAIDWLTVAGDKLFFVVDDGETGRELWTSDGTEAGTRIVHDLRPGTVGSNPLGLVEMNGYLYFSADDGTSGEELWRIPLSTAR